MAYYLELTVATEEHCRAPWLGAKNGKYFRCAFCGHKFVPGDKFRIVYTNDINGASGNPLICGGCDCPNEEARAKWVEKCKVAYSDEWWWFHRSSCGDCDFR